MFALKFLTLFSFFNTLFILNYSNVPDVVDNVSTINLLKGAVKLSRMEYELMATKKYLPKFELRTFSVITPGVKEDNTTDQIPPWAYEIDYSEYGPVLRAEIKLTQPLFTFGKFKHLENSSKHNWESDRYKFVRERVKLIEKIRELILRYSMVEDNLNMITELTEKIDKVIEKAKTMKDVETSELNKLEIFKNSSRAAGNLFESAKKSILETINTLFNESMTVEIFEFYPEDLTDVLFREQFDPNILLNAPKIKEMEEKVRALKSLYKAEVARYYPDIVLLGSFKTSYAPHWPQTYVSCTLNPNCLDFGGGIGINLNLNYLNTLREVRVAKARLDLASKQLSLEKNKYNLKYKKILDEGKSLLRSYLYLKKALKFAKKNLLSELLNFDMGVVKVKDIIDAYKDYLNVKKEFIKVKYEFASQMNKLSTITGKEYMK